jgi:hypothetical protein
MEAKIDLLEKIRQVVENSKSAKTKKVEARKAILESRKLDNAKPKGIVISRGSVGLIAVLPSGMTAAKLLKAKEKFSAKIDDFKNSNDNFLKI